MIRRTTWIVLLAFVVVLAAFFWIQRANQDQEPELTSTQATVKFLDLQEQQITRITLQGSDGKTVELKRPAQGDWTLVLPEPASADNAAVQAALSQFLNAQVVSSPASLPGLDALNLKDALVKILLVNQDGSQIIINVGKETPTGSGYYVLSNNQSQVVVINKFSVDALLKLLETPPFLPTPTVAIEVTPESDQTPVP